MTNKRPLKSVTRAQLEPVWLRHDISVAKIAEALGVTRQALTRHAVDVLGLPPRGDHQTATKKTSDADFIAAWEAGVRTKDIARAFGYSSTGAVSKRRKALGLPPRPRTMRHGRSLYALVEIRLAAAMAAEARS